MDSPTYSNYYGTKCPAGTYDAKNGKGYKLFKSPNHQTFAESELAADKTAIGDSYRDFISKRYTGVYAFYDYHFYKQTCRPCASGLYSSAGQTDCLDTCDKKYTTTITAGEEFTLRACLQTCPDGTSLVGDTCMPCPEGKTSTAGEACQCPIYSYYSYQNGACVETCPDGTSLEGDICMPCPEGKTSAEGGVCQCPIYSYQNGTCVEACGEDDTLNGTTCVIDKRKSLTNQYREFCDTSA